MIEKIQIICGDFDEAIKGLSYESAGRLFKALVAYAEDRDPSEELDDDIPAKTLFPVLKNHIERQEEFRTAMANNGKKGGAPKGNKNANKNNLKQPKTTENNLKQPKTTENNLKQAPNPNPNPNPYIYKTNQFTSGVTIQAYDFAELEKKVVKN